MNMRSPMLRTRLGRWVLTVVLLGCSVAATKARAESKKGEAARWQSSVVTIEVARKQYDYYQPWSRRTQRLQKTGTVIDGHQILTTADEFFDRTLVRLQKGGHGQWFKGEVAWIDYPANLALVTVSDTAFWEGLTPAKLGTFPGGDAPLQIVRWRDGNIEDRHAEFTQFTVREGQLSAVNQAVLETSSDIQNAGWGEPVVANSVVLGLVWAQESRACYAAPASFIRSVLEAHQKGTFHGLGFFHFIWQPSENPSSLAWLKLPGQPRGAIVIEVPARPDTVPQVLKPKDIILRVEGFDIDVQGNYQDPEFGNLQLEYLAVRNKWAGDPVKLDIWRDGKPMSVTYQLPRYTYTNSLVPFATYDKEPEYLMTGGLIFQPLTDSYLQSWGTDWKRRAPFRLLYYRNEEPSKTRPALVVLSQVLPDPFNIGYQEFKYLVVDKVNGQSVHYLPELQDALKHPQNGYQVIDFVTGDSLRRLILAAGSPESEATDRVLQRYGIPESFHFNQ